jgi:hypothetical protein
MVNCSAVAVAGYPCGDLHWRAAPTRGCFEHSPLFDLSHHLTQGGIAEVRLLNATQQAQPGISYAVKFGRPDPMIVKLARLRNQINEGERTILLSDDWRETLLAQLNAAILTWHADFFGAFHHPSAD